MSCLGKKGIITFQKNLDTFSDLNYKVSFRFFLKMLDQTKNIVYKVYFTLA